MGHHRGLHPGVLIWFAIQVVQGATSLILPENVGGIAWWAHIGGFLAGAVLVRRMQPAGFAPPPRSIPLMNSPFRWFA